MDLVGYTNRLNVTPGATLDFMVSSRVGAYDVDIVRLIHGDNSPSGPGFKSTGICRLAEGVAGREYSLPRGSYVVTSQGLTVDLSQGLTVSLWLFPTSLGPGRQAVISLGGDTGFAIGLDADGCLGFALAGNLTTLAQPVAVSEWSFVCATYAPDGRVEMWHRTRVPHPLFEPAHISEVLANADAEVHGSYFLIGAQSRDTVVQPESAECHFNGKIATPRVYAASVEAADLPVLLANDPPSRLVDRCVASWNFSHQPGDTRIEDTSPSALHATVVNCPMRAVTSWSYRGGGQSFAASPAEYDAIMFHADDLDDARWPVAFQFSIPDSLRSGVYAAHLTSQSGTAEDYVPFFVAPAPGAARAPIAVLMPTFSYLAYADEHYTFQNPASPVEHNVVDFMSDADHYALDAELLSFYDFHRDGSGNGYVSLLRPLTNMRPTYRMPLVRAPHQFPADLHLIDWLSEKDFTFDVVTDHDVDESGVASLHDYRVVLTGSHPEYWTQAMWVAMQDYLGQGGRAMYLGGNGMYWVVSRDPARPHLVELRRGHTGTGPWRSQPGEEFSESTGERGGLWRQRGLTPQALFGVGMTAAGYDRSLPYGREQASHDPRAEFIFEGVPDDALIGDAGLVLDGAAGLEIDRADVALGTPSHALVVASARGFSDSYQAVVEEVTHSDSMQGGPVNPRVRADMTYFEGPRGGAVFAVGSMTWCGCLSHHGYENHVSTITQNVLSAFSDASWRPAAYPGED